MIPFSLRLNAWIDETADRIFRECIVNWTEVDDFDPNDVEGTFQRHLQMFKKNKAVNIWTGAGENTIFADNQTNNKARLWHDYTHLTMGLGYDPMSEIQIGKIQQAQLPIHWWYEKALIDADVTGQILYHNAYGEFPRDQRQFTLDYPTGGLPSKQ